MALLLKMHHSVGLDLICFYFSLNMGLICKAAISTVSVSVGVNEHSTQSSKEQLLQWYNGMKKCQHEVVLICVCVCVCDVSVPSISGAVLHRCPISRSRH